MVSLEVFNCKKCHIEITKVNLPLVLFFWALLSLSLLHLFQGLLFEGVSSVSFSSARVFELNTASATGIFALDTGAMWWYSRGAWLPVFVVSWRTPVLVVRWQFPWRKKKEFFSFCFLPPRLSKGNKITVLQGHMKAFLAFIYVLAGQMFF